MSQIRRRSPKYPAQIGNDAVFEQPAALPHSDFSTRGAFLHLSEAFPGQEEHFKDKEFDLIKLVATNLYIYQHTDLTSTLFIASGESW